MYFALGEGPQKSRESSYLKKYLKGKDGVSVENRMRMVRFAEYISGQGGVIIPTTIHSGGSPEVQRIYIRMTANVEELAKRAKEPAGVKEG